MECITPMVKPTFWDYSDAYILVKETVTVPNTAAAVAVESSNNRNKKIINKIYGSFTYCGSEINNLQLDNVKDIDVVIHMYNLIQLSNNYSEKPASLWK